MLLADKAICFTILYQLGTPWKVKVDWKTMIPTIIDLLLDFL